MATLEARQRVKDLRQQRVADGLCAFCGAPRVQFRYLCDECAAEHRERQQAKRRVDAYLGRKRDRTPGKVREPREPRQPGQPRVRGGGVSITIIARLAGVDVATVLVWVHAGQCGLRLPAMGCRRGTTLIRWTMYRAWRDEVQRREGAA